MTDKLKKVSDYVFETYVRPMDKNSEGEQCSNYEWGDAKSMIEDIMDKMKPETFKEASMPLMKYLAENHHPHTKAQVDSGTSELLEGQECFKTDEFIVD